MAALTASDVTLTANGSTQTWDGYKLTQTIPSSSSSAWAVTNSGYNSGIIILQAFVAWQNYVAGGNENICGISLQSSSPSAQIFNDAYSSKIASRALNQGCFRYWNGQGTYNTYNKQDGSVLCGTDVRIVYEVTATTSKFEYWNGRLGEWVTEATTQTRDILNGGSLKAVLFHDNFGGTAIGTATFENVFFGTYGAVYTTHYPDSTAEISGVLGQSNFIETKPEGTITYTAPGKIEIARPTTNPCWVKAKLNRSKKLVILQSDFTWQTNSTNEDLAGIMLHSQYVAANTYDTPYAAKITSRSDSGGKYRLFAGATEYNTYGLADTGVTKGKRVKIVYNSVTNLVDFYYWNGTLWYRMGTPQTFNILNSKTLYATLFYQNLSVATIGTLTFDNVYFDTYDADYATEFPPASTTRSKGGTLFYLKK